MSEWARVVVLITFNGKLECKLSCELDENEAVAINIDDCMSVNVILRFSRNETKRPVLLESM